MTDQHRHNKVESQRHNWDSFSSIWHESVVLTAEVVDTAAEASASIPGAIAAAAATTTFTTTATSSNKQQ